MPAKAKVEDTPEAPEIKEESQLSEMVRRVVLATIGAVVIAQEELEAFINHLVERGEIAEKDGKNLVHEMKEKRKSKTEKVEDEISKNIEGVLQKMNIPSKSDVDALSQKITNLSKKIDELKKS